DRAHQQSAGAATLDDELRGLRVALRNERLRTGDEVAEGGGLAAHLRGLVPAAPEVAAAADVGDGEHHAAIEQRDARRGEARVHRDAVAAVAVQQDRLRSVVKARLAQVAPVDEGDRDLGAVRRTRAHTA